VSFGPRGGPQNPAAGRFHASGNPPVGSNVRIFTDSQNRTIELTVDDKSIARVKRWVHVDLTLPYEIVGHGADRMPLLSAMQLDVPLLASVLSWLCFPSLLSHGISAEDFWELNDAGMLPAAQAAFFHEWAAFFKKPSWRVGNLVTAAVEFATQPV